jgi:hypothetical protein
VRALPDEFHESALDDVLADYHWVVDDRECRQLVATRSRSVEVGRVRAKVENATEATIRPLHEEKARRGGPSLFPDAYG